MFKALAALAAVTVCCLGNEYPAKAQLSQQQLDQVRWEIRADRLGREASDYFEQRQRELEAISESYWSN